MTPPNPPYDRHTCAHDPEQFALGFDRATGWVATARPHRAAFVHRVIATSAGRPWPATATLIGFKPNAYGEGLALGIYGIKALEELDGQA